MTATQTRPLIPVILSGGSGTRLWPLSREERPKQFLPLVADETLFQQTLVRARGLDALRVERPIVVANAAHYELVTEQMRGAGVEAQSVVLEPSGRNTAPAIAVAALLARRSSVGVDPLLLVLPADHVVADAPAFSAAVTKGIGAAVEGELVTFGVVPDKPETGYGYIEVGQPRGGWFSIAKFVEKPDGPTAESYVRSGRYLWNGGMFLFSAARMLEELAAHASSVLSACERAVAAIPSGALTVRLGSEFLSAPAVSIDVAVMEKTARGAVVPLAAGWNDVGSWSALYEVLAHDAVGNALRGDVLLDCCRNSFVSSNHRLVVAVGLDDAIIVETGDAVLVVHRDRAQDIKRIVERLKANGRKPPG